MGDDAPITPHGHKQSQSNHNHSSRPAHLAFFMSIAFALSHERAILCTRWSARPPPRHPPRAHIPNRPAVVAKGLDRIARHPHPHRHLWLVACRAPIGRGTVRIRHPHVNTIAPAPAPHASTRESLWQCTRHPPHRCTRGTRTRQEVRVYATRCFD